MPGQIGFGVGAGLEVVFRFVRRWAFAPNLLGLQLICILGVRVEGNKAAALGSSQYPFD
jgi:hypothetical protein